tara:strand:+ start:1867 stop:2046 length:180 start_codon:yes stop_codon:yes gene_type:complete
MNKYIIRDAESGNEISSHQSLISALTGIDELCVEYNEDANFYEIKVLAKEIYFLNGYGE